MQRGFQSLIQIIHMLLNIRLSLTSQNLRIGNILIYIRYREKIFLQNLHSRLTKIGFLSQYIQSKRLKSTRRQRISKLKLSIIQFPKK